MPAEEDNEDDPAAWSASSTMSREGPDTDIEDPMVREQLAKLRAIATQQI